MLAFQNCTTLIICFPAQIGNVIAPTNWGQVTFLINQLVHLNSSGETCTKASSQASGMLSECWSGLDQYLFK